MHVAVFESLVRNVVAYNKLVFFLDGVGLVVIRAKVNNWVEIYQAYTLPNLAWLIALGLGVFVVCQFNALERIIKHTKGGTVTGVDNLFSFD